MLIADIKNIKKGIKYNLFQAYLPIRAAFVRLQVKRRKKLRIGFYVIYDSTWGSRPLFERLIVNDRFDVKIVVCPDTARGEEYGEQTYNRVYSDLCQMYGENNVLSCYSADHTYVDLKDQFDLISIASPYDYMTYRFYAPGYLCKRKLVFFNDYGYQSGLLFDYDLMKTSAFNLLWKLFLDNSEYRQIARAEQYVHARNTIVSGSCKMDKLAEFTKDADDRKVIMISPHHTVSTGSDKLKLSNFLRLADFFLELPDKYPDVEFIFRPHPLLFVTLSKPENWGQEKVDEYLNTMCSKKNVVYSKQGVYFNDFARSDALIDDCGSYLAEYFYTKKPQCYILNRNVDEDAINSEFRKEFLEHTYIAYEESDIIQFIDDVVLNGKDEKMVSRNTFAEKTVMVNYPSVAKTIEQYFEKFFGLC